MLFVISQWGVVCAESEAQNIGLIKNVWVVLTDEPTVGSSGFVVMV